MKRLFILIAFILMFVLIDCTTEVICPTEPEDPVIDTTTIRDTVIIRDTIIIIDTLFIGDTIKIHHIKFSVDDINQPYEPVDYIRYSINNEKVELFDISIPWTVIIEAKTLDFIQLEVHYRNSVTGGLYATIHSGFKGLCWAWCNGTGHVSLKTVLYNF